MSSSTSQPFRRPAWLKDSIALVSAPPPPPPSLSSSESIPAAVSTTPISAPTPTDSDGIQRSDDDAPLESVTSASTAATSVGSASGGASGSEGGSGSESEKIRDRFMTPEGRLYAPGKSGEESIDKERHKEAIRRLREGGMEEDELLSLQSYYADLSWALDSGAIDRVQALTKRFAYDTAAETERQLRRLYSWTQEAWYTERWGNDRNALISSCVVEFRPLFDYYFGLFRSILHRRIPAEYFDTIMQALLRMQDKSEEDIERIAAQAEHRLSLQQNAPGYRRKIEEIKASGKYKGGDDEDEGIDALALSRDVKKKALQSMKNGKRSVQGSKLSSSTEDEQQQQQQQQQRRQQDQLIGANRAAEEAARRRRQQKNREKVVALAKKKLAKNDSEPA